MIIVKDKKRKFCEGSIKHGTEFMSAEMLSKKVLALQSEIFNIFGHSNGIIDDTQELCQDIWSESMLAFLRNRVLILRPKGSKLNSNDPQADVITQQAANETDTAIANSNFKKYIHNYVSFRRQYDISELIKWARIYLFLKI